MEVATTSSELRIARLFSAGIGLIAVLAFAGARTVVVQPAPLMLPRWYDLLIAALFVFAVTIAIIAPRAQLRTLRRIDGALVIAYLLLAVLLWPALLTGGHASAPGQLTWILTVSSIPVLAAVVAWGARGAWTVLAVVAVSVEVLRFSFGYSSQNTVVNDLDALLSALIVCALGSTLLTLAREADAARDAALEAARQRAEELARHAAQIRTHTIVHDEVLATLAFAARGTDSMLPALAEQAHRASTMLAALAEGPDPSVMVDVRDFCHELRDLADQFGAQIDIVTQIDARSNELPRERVGAILAALHQALVNSVAHAGSGATRAVAVDIAPDRITVIGSDDGRGFDPQRVPADRMGVSASILGRMHELDGGFAQLNSSPGRGTRITLGWQSAATPAVAPIAVSESLWERSDRSLQLILGGMVLSQVLVGIYMAAVSSSPWHSLLAVAGICIALAVVGRGATRRPGVRTVVLVCALLVAVCSVIFLPGTPDRIHYADLWYIPGCSLVLLMLCLRGRPLAAFVGLGLCIAVTLIGVEANESESKQVAAAIFRAIVVLVLGSLLLAGIRWARRSAARSRAAEIAGLEERAWAAELRTELHRGAEEVGTLVSPILATIELGRPLTEAEKRQCVVLEGRLRDDFRGGRLAREPLRSAAAVARARGIDVVLVDDVSNHEIPDQTLSAIAQWMAAQLEAAESASFAGHLLPAGRGRLAVAVAGDLATSFGG